MSTFQSKPCHSDYQKKNLKQAMKID